MQIVSRLELSIERAGLNRSCAIQYEGVFYRSDRLLGGAAARLGRVFFLRKAGINRVLRSLSRRSPRVTGA